MKLCIWRLHAPSYRPISKRAVLWLIWCHRRRTWTEAITVSDGIAATFTPPVEIGRTYCPYIYNRVLVLISTLLRAEKRIAGRRGSPKGRPILGPLMKIGKQLAFEQLAEEIALDSPAFSAVRCWRVPCFELYSARWAKRSECQQCMLHILYMRSEWAHGIAFFLSFYLFIFFFCCKGR